jgi:competence ComEA-like helix-hairpin-helix protein
MRAIQKARLFKSDAFPYSSGSSRSRKTSIAELQQNPLDLNTASEKELSAIPGVGPKIAFSIVKHRKTNGFFTSIEQLADIEKITKSMIDKHQWQTCFAIH